jgi:hypothetical protein
MTLRTPLALALVLAACGDDGGSMTADALPDPCAPDVTFTGEYLDWDSGGDPGFLGIFSADVTLRSDPSITDITAPNGRWELCVPSGDDLADVAPMSGSDYVSGTIVLDASVLAALPTLSYRSFTATRAADFGFDVSKAHVLVQVVGGSRTVTTASTPGIMQVNDGTAWSAGNTGSTIYLGNIDVAANTTLTVSGGVVVGTETVPLSAGAFTYVTLLAR